jgi:1-acyl-sn-glycerol-3-phosphate acyltransferase
MRRLSRLWRIARFGLAYLTFAAVVLAVSYVAVPLLRWRTSGPGLDLRAQRALHGAARLLLRVVLVLRIVKATRIGTERLRQPGPLLVVANHPSLLDTPSLLAVMPEVDFVVEASWAEKPIVRSAIAACAYLRNDAGAETVEQGAARLRAGRRLLIFPEGSRSPAGGLHPFRRGAAHIALASGCNILPVFVRCDPPVGTKGGEWYEVPDRQPKFSLRVGASFHPRDHLDGSESRGVAARKVTAALRDLYVRELGIAES